MPMLFHKTLDKEQMTCAGSVGLMSKLGRLPVIARLGLAYGVITKTDIEASARMVIDPSTLALPSTKVRPKKSSSL